ncbi:unnamed protein product [Aspergillus oryzae]|uniref:Unnamed protein product n=1 Tax=Aspergillus oryzae TaxID=5062 RepID=A0AAN5C1U1_ASPOZ|nr:unnamed protein product [Aspergillus oryzae]
MTAEDICPLDDPKHGVNVESLQDQAAAFDLSFREVQPVDIRVKDLSLEVDISPPIWETAPSQIWRRLRGKTTTDARKTVLDGIDAYMPSGSLTAIIGSSGSGKTSLLNLMAGRMGMTKASVAGTTTFNGDANIESVRSAYVMQEDVLIPTLTVRETLRYSADLRLPPPTTQEERHQTVEQVIMELGLKECADTRIGTNIHKGCSGGEKRRTSIGVQMLANPSVLFCDEPTTGLDATSAFQIVRTLKRLAQKGRTVIISIHAPRSEIWSLFDNVVLLARGSVLYSGLSSRSLSYFENHGHVIPPFVNPAEFLIDLAAIDNRTEELEAASLARVDFLKTSWRTEEKTEKEVLGSRKDDEKSITRAQAIPIARAVSFSRQFRVLTSRTFKTTIRDPMGLAGSLLEAVGMGVISGWIFLQLDESQAGIRSRQGSLYTSSSLNGYLILLYETYRLTIDIRQFDRERTEGVVGVPAFLLSRRAARLPLEDLPVPIIFAVIFYFMVGYRLSVGQFFIFLALTILTHYIAITFAAVSIGIARSFPGASLVGNLSFTVQSFACGYFVQSNQIPVYVRWLKWVAYTFYIFGALCANEFIGPNGPPEGQFYDCPFSDDPNDPACTQYTGRYIMESLGFPPNWIWRPIVVLVAFVVGHYLLAGILLQYNHFAMDIAQARKSDKDTSTGVEKMAVRPAEEARKKNRRAEEVLLKMGLKECADNLIGSELIKGISGGEKRRVTIAIQILTDPKVLLLDEPTSGLDAFTAMSIIEVLKGLAEEGRTLVMTIHQARSDLFQHFSSVLLLARGGYPVYAGDGATMLSHFGALGYHCPQTTNPADFVLDLITVDLQQVDREAVTRERVQKLILSWDDKTFDLGRQTSHIATPAELGSLKRQMLPFRITYPLVLRRSAINFWRQPPLVMARSMQVVGIGIIMALFFAPLKNDYAAVQSRMGFIQEFGALYFVGALGPPYLRVYLNLHV